MTRAYDFITFDCYGTLIDWEAGIGDAFDQIAKRKGATLERRAVLDTYAEIEPLNQKKTYASYRDILTRTAIDVCARLGLDISPEEAHLLPESLPSWPVFPDTNAALRRLVSAGYNLGILSNVDEDLFAATKTHFEVDFDLVITAERVRSYKPAPGHFNAAREAIGGARWVHAAQSHFHDIVPTRALGIPNAWVNRLREPIPAIAPDHLVFDMEGLAKALA